MNEKIIEMICELARSGGNAAVWMYVLYMVIGLLKYIIGWTCGMWVIIQIAKLATTAIDAAETST